VSWDQRNRSSNSLSRTATSLVARCARHIRGRHGTSTEPARARQIRVVRGVSVGQRGCWPFRVADRRTCGNPSSASTSSAAAKLPTRCTEPPSGPVQEARVAVSLPAQRQRPGHARLPRRADRLGGQGGGTAGGADVPAAQWSRRPPERRPAWTVATSAFRPRTSTLLCWILVWPNPEPALPGPYTRHCVESRSTNASHGDAHRAHLRRRPVRMLVRPTHR